MRLTADFSVPLPLGEAWDLLQDVERVARWFPGARLEESDGERHRGTVRVKLGPMHIDYRGTATFLERDEAARRVVIEASGREQRGAGTATARAVTSLSGAGGGTAVSVAVELDITGRPAQLGQGLLQEVAERLVGEFAARMATELSGAGAAPPRAMPGAEADDVPGADGASERGDAPQRAGRLPSDEDDDALDLGRAAGPALLRRAVPVLAGVLLLAVVALWGARRMRRRP